MNEDKLQKPKITPIEEAYYEWGLYFWQLPDGHLFHDGSGNFLTVQAEHKADLNAVKKITDAAKYYGKEGKPWFKAGARQVSDAEYSEQLDRLKEGEIPSLNDLGAVYDAQRGLKEHGGE